MFFVASISLRLKKKRKEKSLSRLDFKPIKKVKKYIFLSFVEARCMYIVQHLVVSFVSVKLPRPKACHMDSLQHFCKRSGFVSMTWQHAVRGSMLVYSPSAM